MVETSLREIFLGDIPRIDTMSIFPGGVLIVGLVGSLGLGGSYILGDTAIVFNTIREHFDRLVSHFKVSDRAVFVLRTLEGFRVEFGVLPESFRVTFSLPDRVTFRESDLSGGDHILKLVGEIKKFQEDLDGGLIGTAAYVTTGNLWGRVRWLNKLLTESVLTEWADG